MVGFVGKNGENKKNGFSIVEVMCFNKCVQANVYDFDGTVRAAPWRCIPPFFFLHLPLLLLQFSLQGIQGLDSRITACRIPKTLIFFSSSICVHEWHTPSCAPQSGFYNIVYFIYTHIYSIYKLTRQQFFK